VKRAGAIAVVFAFALVLATGCAKKVYYVQLSDAWPSKTREFDDVAKSWTRHGRLMSGWDKVLEFHATFMSPEWRAAYVAERTKLQRLRQKDRANLTEKHTAAAKKFHEVELLLSTYEQRENDLSRGKRSMWRIWLIDGDGKQVVPVSIKKDKRPRGVINQYFPDLHDFDTAYVVRFPRTIDVLRSGGKQFSLRIASAHGAVEVVWLERAGK